MSRVIISRHSGENLDLRKFCLIIISLVLFFAVKGIAQTNISAGNVSGTWTKVNSPYHILGEITVPNGETLTIEPGVSVVFMGHYKFNVQGRLLAVGTQQDSISFTAENTGTGWHGIRFINTPNTNDLSNIVFCSFRYGKANTGSGLDRSGGAIMINGYSNVFISDCLFEYNMTSGDVGTTGGPGVCIFYGSPTVTKSTFINNDGTAGSAGAIKVDFTSNAVISNNIISNNTSSWGSIICGYQSDNQPTISGNIISNNVATVAAGGILIYSYVKPRIENNIIIHNQAPIGGGIYCLTNAKPVLINNTIAYNSATSGGGIYCDANSDPVFMNNVIYGNSAQNGSQVYINDAQSDPVFVYCDIQGGKDGFGGSGAGVNYTGLYENNIVTDPSFVNALLNDLKLSDYSPCIGAATNSVEIAGVWYYIPPFCIGGNPRPSPSGTMPDIGACENLIGSPLVGIVRELPIPREFTLEQNYPNPFNPTTSIGYVLQEKSNAKLTLLNVIGEEIGELVNEVQDKGYYKVEFDGSRLSSGVYFYRLQAENFVETKKMILLR